MALATGAGAVPNSHLPPSPLPYSPIEAVTQEGDRATHIIVKAYMYRNGFFTKIVTTPSPALI